MRCISIRTVQRGLKDAKCNSQAKVRGMDRKIEDYLPKLNQNGQFGVILYSNDDLIVPEQREGYLPSKQCHVGETSEFRSFISDVWDNWEVLPDKHLNTEGKQVFMTFEAVAAAVRAYRCSIPVISVDGCFLKCSYSRAVLFTATFETTDGHILTMCYGTAPSESNESWGFFMLNLRHVLYKFAGITDWRQIIFMSDRHKSIERSIEVHFPGAFHLYCALHIMRDIFPGQEHVPVFWQAVQAVKVSELNEALAHFPQTAAVRELKEKAYK